MRRLKILHLMRAPTGGLFRHVVDLARAQTERGHEVGIIADATTGSGRSDAVLAELASILALGITRIPMSRHLGIRDIAAYRHVRTIGERGAVDILHGHGAKGGAYARLAPRGRYIRVYTPHGGSLHYSRRSPLGLLYLTLERALMPRTELFLFESAYGRDVFRARIGSPASLVRIVHNGVAQWEFTPIANDDDSTDLVFVGELRMLKGVDVLIDALALLKAEGEILTASIVGDGPDSASLRTQADRCGLGGQIRFLGPLPARAAFAKGRILVVPSRAESLPYIVLEAAAAGMPLIATAVGGIPEIFGNDAAALIPAGDPRALARTLRQNRAQPALAHDLSKRLQGIVRTSFSVDAMTTQVLTAYGEALAGK